MADTVQKYGLQWPLGTDALKVEFYMIQNGGQWKIGNTTVGMGLFHHYKEAQKLLWPEDDHHRWSDLFLSSVCQYDMLTVMGCQNACKTYSAAKYALVDYWCYPDETMILVSSTDIRGLELRVWGAIKGLFNRAKDRYEWLAGVVLESVRTITTNSADDERARELRKGIICIPCLQGGRYVGLGKYVGIKQKRVRLISDECQFMGQNFLDSVANLSGNRSFKGIMLGNPNDPLDPLGMAGEPVDGWTSMPEPKKTTTWRTRFHNGLCINFVGTDSPNYDPPNDPMKPRYPYLQNQPQIDKIVAFWTKDSQQYYSQAIGVMKTGLLSKRIITRELCRQHKALDKAVWKSDKITKIYAIDAAYSGTGGDRCVGGWIEFGENTEGVTILKVNPPKVIPVSINTTETPEDQIAKYVKRDLENNGIKPENTFYDSTGRGTLGAAFARLFGTVTPVPVEFGGRPSKRPVRHDLFVSEGRERRLKRCDEHYLDFVSELWFSARYIIECDQMRELSEDVMQEGCGREYGTAGSNKLFVESKHDPKARERMKRSPDLFDWLVTACEGARQRGFIIQRLGADLTEDKGDEWLLERAKNLRTLQASKQIRWR